MLRASAPDGTTVSFTDTGEPEGVAPSTPIVLVHGITETHRSWDPVVERLSKTRRTVAVDLRGHGSSGWASDYGLGAMVGDVAAAIEAAGLTTPHLVGHSLGGAVVSAAGAALPVSSVVNVDQSLQLGDFKAALATLEPRLRDSLSFQSAIDDLFASMVGPLERREVERVSGIRSADQRVVLKIWELVLTSPVEEIEATVEQALAGYADTTMPFLSLFGIDPGAEYPAWISARIPAAVTETWSEHGHYPHLVDPDRFVARLEAFWAGA